MAPKATLIGVKVLDENGGGYESDVIAGIEHCADPDLPNGPTDVINLSLGGDGFSGNCDSDSVAEAANNAVDTGVVVVAAAGNDGYLNALITPACGSKVIAVGATYKDDYPNCDISNSSFSWCLDSECTETCTDSSPYQDDLVCFSNNSDDIDVTAPGSFIWSAKANSYNTNPFRKMSGTSQASPHVAGLAALILSADPSLTPVQVRQIIQEGAVDMGPEGFDPGYGYGIIDVIQSLSLLNIYKGDFDLDGDVDGSDLAMLIDNPELVDISEFAANFGRIISF